MTDQNYTHTCQVCKTEFPPTMNKDGSIRKRKYETCSQFCYKIAAGYRKPDTSRRRTPQYGVKIMVCCKFCKSFFGPLLPGQARKVTYCSKQCTAGSQSHKQLPDGTWVKPNRRCTYCSETFETSNGRVKFCGKSCSASYKKTGYTKAVWTEVKALRSIASRVSKALKYEPPEHVVSEIKALRSIAKNISSRIRECVNCGKTHIRRRPFSRMCSAECETEYRQKAKEAYKQTESYKKIRRAAKSRRRARIRGAGIADKIDPIEVFENARWICHICGGKTLKSKRGTTHDRAPELEHIVALANGGTHTWGNVACACRKCNIEKGASDYGQMGLALAGVGKNSRIMPM